jgi:hypothetical protein
MKLKDVKFDHTIDPLKPSRGSGSDSDGGSISDRASIASDEHFVPVELTVKPGEKPKPPPIRTTPPPGNGTVNEDGVKAVDFAGEQGEEGEEGQEVEVPPSASNPATPVTASSMNGRPPVSEGIEMTTEELLAQRKCRFTWLLIVSDGFFGIRIWHHRIQHYLWTLVEEGSY